MTEQLYTKIIDQLPSNTVIVPFFRGESMLHPHFDAMMEKLQRFETVQFTTNADFLDDYAQKKILNSCTFVTLSLHEYQLPTQTSWTKFLLEAKKENVTTQIGIIDSTLPQANKKEFIQAWLKHADRVRIYAEHSHNGYGDIPNPPVLDVNLRCKKPFEELAVYWDGQVALCNHDWNNHDGLGDLNTMSIHDVWHGLAYAGIREYNQEGQRARIGSCQNCDAWRTYYLPSGILGELYTN